MSERYLHNFATHGDIILQKPACLRENKSPIKNSHWSVNYRQKVCRAHQQIEQHRFHSPGVSCWMSFEMIMRNVTFINAEQKRRGFFY